MDTSLIDVDVQPTYVRILVKGKVRVFLGLLWLQPLNFMTHSGTSGRRFT